MYIYRFILILISLGLANHVSAEIPSHVVPGVSENEVRAALQLTGCSPRAADPRIVDCETGNSDFSGIPGTYKVSFIGGRLMLAHFFMERQHFAAATRAVSESMGEPNRTESFELPVVVNGQVAKQEEKIWGNARLFATVSLYTPGMDNYASIFLVHPAAVPKDMHDAYLPSKR